MNRVHYPHLLTSFSVSSRVRGKEKIWAPVAELFSFPWSSEFGLRVLIQMGILLKRGGKEVEGCIKIMSALSRVCTVGM